MAESKAKKTTKKEATKKTEPAKVTRVTAENASPELLNELRSNLAETRVDMMTGKQKNQKLVGQFKRNIARALTFINQKNKEQNAETN